MSDEFLILPYQVRSAGTDVPPEEVQAAINSLARQTTLALNQTVGLPPAGPAGGDLSGTYPNPTVTTLHVTGGTESGVAITASTVNSTPVGSTTPSTGAFTTLTASTPVAVASGGTGQNALSAHNVLLGEGTAGVGFAAPGAAGQMLISAGAAADPAFGGAPTITGGSINSAPIGQTTPAAVAATNLSSNGTVSGTGFSTYLASPPAIGGTAPAAGAFTNLSSSGTVSGTGFSTYLASPPAIGGTAPAAGAFTTLSSTGAYTPSQTNGIVGTTTNNNANAGSVGEYITNTGSGISLPIAGTQENITSISLTAGDWDVWGGCSISNSATQMSDGAAGVSTVSATLPVAGQYGQVAAGAMFAAIAVAAPTTRLLLAATTTVYLVAIGAAAGGASTGAGYIAARRVR